MAQEPPWKTCLDPAYQSAGHYLDYVHAPLFPLIDGTPARVLDLGCATGAFGAALKQRYPGAHVAGIEAGDAAAKVAAGRLDRVVHASLDGLDFAAHGFEPGSIDVAIASDVLEHLVNPWDLLVRLKPFPTPATSPWPGRCWARESCVTRSAACSTSRTCASSR
jgi:SAM-dependent methyltransferase